MGQPGKIKTPSGSALGKGGGLSEFDGIFDRYYPALCAYATRYVSIEDAENIVQDVMMWLWENRSTVVIEDSLENYLFRAVRNRALTLINRGVVHRKVVEAMHKAMHDRTDGSDFYSVRELVSQLEAALEKLPDSYRQAFEMHRFYNKSYKQIADELGVSPKTVDYRIGQALKILREMLKDFLPVMKFLL